MYAARRLEKPRPMHTKSRISTPCTPVHSRPLPIHSHRPSMLSRLRLSLPSRADTLRYTGGLVPDVTQLIVKGRGIFTSVPCADERPRLRLLYEAIPMAFLLEKAGGASSDGETSLLDIPVLDPDARTQVALGSAAEVRRFEEMVGPVWIQAQEAASEPERERSL